MDSLAELLQVKKEKIQQNPKIKQLLTNWQNIFIYYFRIEGQPHLKWPQQLTLSPDGLKNKFASFPFDTTESSSYLTILIVVGIIAAMLFPKWPIYLKIFICTQLNILCIFSGHPNFQNCYLSVWSYIWRQFWLFPQILQNVGVIESFTPIYSCTLWERGNMTSLITRLVVLSLFIFYGIHIYLDPTIVTENIQITQTIFSDINDWGLGKMKGQRNFTESALTDYSKLLNITNFDDED